MSNDLRIVKVKGMDGEAVTFQFVNRWSSHQYGFTHISDLYRINENGGECYSAYIGEGRAHWVNRTWECYTYETAMRAAVNNEIDFLKSHIKELYKAENGFQKITAKRREGLEAEYNKDARLYLYNELLKALKALR